MDHVYVTPGTYSATVTVTDDGGASDTESVVVTVSSPNTGTSHIADLDGSAVSSGRTWTATVTIVVRDGAGSLVAGATVSGTWKRGAVVTCITSASGTCSVVATGRGRSQVFTVTGVAHASLGYDPAANTDPDGDSNGTVITINKP